MEEEVKVVVKLDVHTGDDLPNHGEEEPRETTEVKRKLRDLPPAHYLFKIENFSLISDAKIDNYESIEFEVGGYKWKLCVYPEGKKKVNEKGHISLYLVLSESNSLPLHREVNVSFKLFVYNQILDKYLSVQDAEERVRRFRGAVTEWGFEQFVPLNVFNDPSNGYLVNDCCIFGAEVFVLDRTSKGECASVVKKIRNNNTYTWNIENYWQLKGECYNSPEFVIGGYKWTLCAYPNGYAKEEGKSLSMYLCLEEDSKALNPGETLHFRYIIRIRGQIQESKDIERLANYKQYCSASSCSSWGFHDFMPLSYLKEPSQGYVNPDGIMIAEVQILLMTLVKDFS